MASRRPASIWLWLGIAAAVVLLDQITKTMITRSFQLNDLRTITPFFDLVEQHHRRGDAEPEPDRGGALGGHQAMRRGSPAPNRLPVQRPQIVGCAGSMPTSLR